MTTCFLAPDPIQSTQFIPGGNTPANGGQLFFYVAGSSTKQTVYKDNAAATPWTNPIVLDSGGNLPSGGEVWFPSGQMFKVVFAPSNDQDPPVSPYWSKDNLSGINDVSGGALEWVAGPTATYVSGTQFTLVGDQTLTFYAGRRLKFTVTAGTVYGEITQSAFGSVTTVNVAFDSGQLDNGLAQVWYSLINSTNPSISADYIHRKGANVASAGTGTTNIWGIAGDYIHITGTNSIFHFSTAPYAGAQRDVIFDNALILSSSAALTMPANLNVTTATNDRAKVIADTVTSTIISFYSQSGKALSFGGTASTGIAISGNNISINVSTMSNYLSSDVLLNTTASYFDGPSVAQGTSGTWNASGTVTMTDTGVQAHLFAKLWDGTKVISSLAVDMGGSGLPTPVTLTGTFINPTGNIRISCRDSSATTGKILFNQSGNSTDSGITVQRISI